MYLKCQIHYEIKYIRREASDIGQKRARCERSDWETQIHVNHTQSIYLEYQIHFEIQGREASDIGQR